MKDPVASGRRSRALLLAGAVVAAVAAPSVLRGLPEEQTIHYRLGDAAASVRELDARWKEDRGSEDWTREVSFRYAPKTAPRVVTHEPRLADGNYTVQIEIVAETAGNKSGAPSELSRVVERHVTLGGGSVTTIELAAAVPRAGAGLEQAPR
ncbi:MAG TPA: hypothetical protein VKU41_15835 [Polyangiaceae bacterium]|nr:hypothetical protein [Polyangiaceae bacterium]